MLFFWVCKNTEEHYIYTLKSWRPTQLATIANSSSPGEKRHDGIGESTFNDFQSAFDGDQKQTCGVDGYSRWRWKLGRIFRLDDTWTYTTQRFFFLVIRARFCLIFLIFFRFHLILSVSIPTMRKRFFAQQLASSSLQPFRLFTSSLPFHPIKLGQKFPFKPSVEFDWYSTEHARLRN